MEYFHLKFRELPPRPTGPKIYCDGCEKILQPGCVFFYCHCAEEGTDLCIACSLSDTPILVQHGSLKPCLLDIRDLRRTYVDGPKPREFRTIIKKIRQDSEWKFPRNWFKFFYGSEPAARQDPEWKLPRNWFKFFHGIEVKGLDTSRFASSCGSENPQQFPTKSAVERRIPNDYSMYQDLDKNKKEIRLVGIPPGQQDDPLCAVLRTIQYPWDRVQWAALSYRWGPLDETRAIPLGYYYGPDNIECHRFLCTANLDRALRAIRKEEEPVWIWVDALCINQGDLDERAYQIRLMSEIYTRAFEAVIWLDTTEEENLAVEWIRKLMTIKNDDRDVLSSLVGCPDIKINGKDADIGKLAEMMGAIFGNPWFSRAWVLQEVWAARMATVLCSHGSGLPWETLVRASKLTSLAQTTRRWLPAGHSKSLSEPWTRLEKASPGQAGPRLPIFTLFLDVCQGFEVTDPRDKLYSILGIARETHNIADLPPLLAPDYKKPVWQVFSDFTRWHIQQTQSLEGLEYAADMRVDGGNDEVASLPSWSLSPTYNHSSGVTHGCGPSGEPLFHADNGIGINSGLIGDTPGSRDLTLRGYRLEPANLVDPCYMRTTNIFRKECGKSWPCRIDPNGTHAEGGLKFFWERTKFVNRADDDGECDIRGHHEAPKCLCCRGLDALLDVLTCGLFVCHGCDKRDDEATIHPSRALSEPELYAGFAAAWAEQTGDADLSRFCNNLRGRLLPSKDEANPRPFQNAMMSSDYKSVFITKSNKMGLCPPDTRAGDQVVVLFGGRKPFILREEQDEETGSAYWRFIGECYLASAMGGGPVRRRLESNDEPETFVLR